MGYRVIWFKRDLRVQDHWPLHEAARQGPVLGGRVGLRPQAGLDDVQAQHRAALRGVPQRPVVAYAQIALEPDDAVAHAAWRGLQLLARRLSQRIRPPTIGSFSYSSSAASQ
jgi:deoxyribodipyrimidine photolyase